MKANKRPASGSAAIKPAAKLPLLNPHAAGIDIGSVEHYVCVPAGAVPACESPVRSFRGFTAKKGFAHSIVHLLADLLRWTKWLTQ